MRFVFTNIHHTSLSFEQIIEAEVTTPNLNSILEDTKLNGCSKVLLSIGYHMDKAMDLLQLSDEILPKLHWLATNLWSSHWSRILESPEFNMKTDAAAILAVALVKDLKDVKKVLKVHLIQSLKLV